MKHKFFFKLLGVITLCLSFAIMLASCNSDEDNPKMPKVKMAVTSMYGGYDADYGGSLPGYDYVFKDVKYDSQGRPISYMDCTKIGDGEMVTYTYSDSKIIVSKEGLKQEIVLTDGLIKDNRKYGYNQENQLVKDEDYRILWDDGNPAKIVHYIHDNDFDTCSYYPDSNVLACFQGLTYSVTYLNAEHPLLQAVGYYGKLPLNMLKSLSDENGEIYVTFLYSNYNEYGYPCTMEVFNNGYKQIYEFTWIKI